MSSPVPAAPRRRHGAPYGALAFFVLLTGCAEPREQAEETLETVDVAPSVDVDLSHQEDTQAERIAEGLSGVLPGGFPEDLPLYLPASVVDVEVGENGRPTVVLQSAATPQRLEEFLSQQLPRAGWQPQAGGRYRHRDGRLVDIAVEAAGNVSRLRITYR